jgi:hypothetical protein
VTSTTRRAARLRLTVRDASSWICAQAPAEIGASERYRLLSADSPLPVIVILP